MKIKNIIIIGIISIIFISLLFIFYYLFSYYKADKDIFKYLVTDENVKINKIDNGYFFDGEGSNEALIFYPGGKVEYTAYSKLMYDLSSNGIDCFLIEMPFNLAIFNVDAANSITSKYSYDSWILGGHSLGGVSASMHLNNNPNKYKGIVFLASYPTSKIDNNIRVLSIYGNKDGVLNMTKYNENKDNFGNNMKEVIINGGNHSQFGRYGFQDGDNKASISYDEQEKITTEEILNNFLTN